MKFSVLTIFPELIETFAGIGLIGKAVERNLLAIEAINLRSHAGNRHLKVDDRPFGGGAGMVLMPGPLFSAIEFIRAKQPGRVILFSAYGARFTQEKAKELAGNDHLILVCGRYEGVDQRVIDTLVDEEISIGEYVLMGGEAAAQVVIEATARMIPGVVGNPESVTTDSFYQEGQMAFPQYTQPREFRGMEVPSVLVSGNHRDIEAWRQTRQKGKERHS